MSVELELQFNVHYESSSLFILNILVIFIALQFVLKFVNYCRLYILQKRLPPNHIPTQAWVTTLDTQLMETQRLVLEQKL